MTDGSLTDQQVHSWLQFVADTSFLSLHFESPALGGSAKGEITGGGYHRAQAYFSDPSNRAIWTTQDAKFTGLLPTRITYFGVWTKLNGGWLRGYGELPRPATILSGKGYILHQGEVAISLG